MLYKISKRKVCILSNCYKLQYYVEFCPIMLLKILNLNTTNKYKCYKFLDILTCFKFVIYYRQSNQVSINKF